MRALLNWVAMGGYASYVWSTYAILLLALASGVVRARLKRAHMGRMLQRSLEFVA